MAILDTEMGNVNEDNVSPQQVIVKYGLITALFLIILSLLSSLMGLASKGFGTMMLLLLLTIVGGILLTVYAIREHRDQQLGGFISFKRVFIITLGIAIIAGIISQLFSYVYSNFINPNSITETMDATRSMMEKMSLPEEAVEKAIQEAEANIKSPMSIVKGAISSVIGGAIFGAIMGAIMKKVPRPF
jgi:hypothetical protein